MFVFHLQRLYFAPIGKGRDKEFSVCIFYTCKKKLYKLGIYRERLTARIRNVPLIAIHLQMHLQYINLTNL